MKNRNFFEISLFLLIITLTLGETSIFDIKLSWIFSVLAIIALLGSPKFRIYLDKDKTYLLAFLLFWATYSFLLFLFRVDYPQSIEGIFSLLVNIVVVLFLLIAIKDKQQVSFYIKAIRIGLIITFYFAFQNVYLGSYVIDIDPDLIRYRNVPVAFFGNPNDYATFLVICIFSIFVDSVIKRKITFSDILLIITSIFFLSQSGSRSSIVALLFFILMLVFYWILERMTKKSNFSYHTAILITMIPTIFLILFPELFFNIITAIISNEQNIISDIYRLSIIKSSIALFLQSGLLGVGALNSTLVLGINPHNMIIEILTDYGIFIYLGYLIATYIILTNAKEGSNSSSKIVIYSIIPSYFILSNASSSMLRIRYSWILFAIIYIYAILSKNRERDFKKNGSN
jgi:teichuronic acid biosynthesis protein TuaE